MEEGGGFVVTAVFGLLLLLVVVFVVLGRDSGPRMQPPITVELEKAERAVLEASQERLAFSYTK